MIGGVLEIKTLNYRNLEMGKSDFLLKDITFSIIQDFKAENLKKSKN